MEHQQKCDSLKLLHAVEIESQGRRKLAKQSNLFLECFLTCSSSSQISEVISFEGLTGVKETCTSLTTNITTSRIKNASCALDYFTLKH